MHGLGCVFVYQPKGNAADDERSADQRNVFKEGIEQPGFFDKQADNHGRNKSDHDAEGKASRFRTRRQADDGSP